jgi:hypothetical protein
VLVAAWRHVRCSLPPAHPPASGCPSPTPPPCMPARRPAAAPAARAAPAPAWTPGPAEAGAARERGSVFSGCFAFPRRPRSPRPSTLSMPGLQERCGGCRCGGSSHRSRSSSSSGAAAATVAQSDSSMMAGCEAVKTRSAPGCNRSVLLLASHAPRTICVLDCNTNCAEVAVVSRDDDDATSSRAAGPAAPPRR